MNIGSPIQKVKKNKLSFKCTAMVQKIIIISGTLFIKKFIIIDNYYKMYSR